MRFFLFFSPVRSYRQDSGRFKILQINPQDDNGKVNGEWRRVSSLPLEGKVGNLPDTRVEANWSDEVEAYPTNQ